MTLSFVIPEFNIGGAGTPPLQFFKRSFVLGGTSGGGGGWQDVILKGSTALTLVNAKANSLQYLKLYGKCSQTGTPTPTVPVDIVCNNGVISYDTVNQQITVTGTTETVQVTGKNLLNINRDSATVSGLNVSTNNQTLTVTGTQSQSFANISLTNNGTAVNVASILTASSGVKKFNKDITYTIKFSDYSDIYDVKIVKYDKSTQTTILLTNGVATFTPTYDVCDIWIRISGNNTARNISTTVMLELGDTATTYEPYYNGGTATATDLLAVGDYKDVQEVLTGDVTRNIGIKVLDGTESYGVSSAYGRAVYITSAASVWKADKSKKVTSTHFLGVAPVTAGTQPADSCFFNASGHFYFRTSESAADFKTWVGEQYNAGTPVIVIYPLATATTESVTGQHLTIKSGTNTIEITQASIDNLELEVKYKAGVTVTIEEIEDAQLSNDVTVTVS